MTMSMSTVQIYHLTEDGIRRNVATGETDTFRGQPGYAYVVMNGGVYLGAANNLTMALAMARVSDPTFDLPGVDVRPNTRYRTRLGNEVYIFGRSPYSNHWVGVTKDSEPVSWYERGFYNHNRVGSGLDLIEEIG